MPDILQRLHPIPNRGAVQSVRAPLAQGRWKRARSRALSRAAYALIASFSIAITVPAHAAPSGSIEDFLNRADRLMALGPLAMAAPDAHRLKAEVIDAALRYKARNDAQRKAGQPRRSCPPESGEVEPEEWLGHLRSFPAALRPRLSISFAVEHYMEKRFPCTAG